VKESLKGVIFAVTCAEFIKQEREDPSRLGDGKKVIPLVLLPMELITVIRAKKKNKVV
jgi:hypothetical protein